MLVVHAMFVVDIGLVVVYNVDVDVGRAELVVVLVVLAVATWAEDELEDELVDEEEVSNVPTALHVPNSGWLYTYSPWSVWRR